VWSKSTEWQKPFERPFYRLACTFPTAFTNSASAFLLVTYIKKDLLKFLDFPMISLSLSVYFCWRGRQVPAAAILPTTQSALVHSALCRICCLPTKENIMACGSQHKIQIAHWHWARLHAHQNADNYWNNLI